MSDIRKLPAQTERVETGPMQFGDDWPGVFIRGDNAFHFATLLRAYIAAKATDGDNWLTAMMVQQLADLLASCDLTGLSREGRAEARKD